MIDDRNSRLTVTLEEIASTADNTSLVEIMRKVTVRYGLKSAAYLGSGITSIQQQQPYLAVTYSPDWVEHYKEQNYVEIDPIVQRGLRRLLPLDWDEVDRSEKAVKIFFGEASEFGLGRRGLSVPVHGRNGDRGLLSVSFDMTTREWAIEKQRFLRDFQVAAVHVHDKVLQLAGRNLTRASLSPREHECLRWIANGKTAWECSVILGLSERTVRFYLESARHKLNATSNTHAVSIAHRSGLLFDPL